MTRAVVFTAPGRPLTVEEIEVAPPGPAEISVAVAASGVCHSDLHTLERGAAGMLHPLVLGHEAAGRVVSVGPGVTGFAPGDHVVLGVFPQCGDCVECLNGTPTLCTKGLTTTRGTLLDGTSRFTRNGEVVGQFAGLAAWSELTVVSELSAVRIDPTMPLESAALLGCGVVTGFGAVANVAQVSAGQTMAVLGCGGLGLSAIQAGRIAKAERIVAVDTNPRKLELAQNVGATDLVDASTGDPIEQVRALTGGVGTDFSFDFVGTAKTAPTTLAMARRGGTTVLTGLSEPAFEFSINDLIRAGRTIKGNLMGMGSFAEDFPKLVALYQSGELLLDELVSQRLRIDQTDEAFRAMTAGEVARSVLVMS